MSVAAVARRRFGVTVNAVAPGMIATAMTEEAAKQGGVPVEDMQRLRRWAEGLAGATRRVLSRSARARIRIPLRVVRFHR